MEKAVKKINIMSVPGTEFSIHIKKRNCVMYI